MPADELDALSRRVARLAPRASLHRSGHVPTALVVEAGRHLPPSALAGRRVCAFCGIGNPESFFEALAEAGADLAERIAFEDHVAYGPAELERLVRAIRACGAEAAVTTAKDRVKLTGRELPVPLWTLMVEVRITAGEEALLEKLRAAVGR